MTSIERTNIRYFDGRCLDEPIDLAVIDTSFISLKLVVPAVLRLIRADAVLLALIKPQFEVGRAAVETNDFEGAFERIVTAVSALAKAGA